MVPVIGKPMKLALEAPARAIISLGRETSSLALEMLKKAQRVAYMEVDIGGVPRKENDLGAEHAAWQQGKDRMREDETELE